MEHGRSAFRKWDTERWKGYLPVAGAAFLWAVSGTSAKALFHHGLPPTSLVQLRVTCAALVAFCWFVFHDRTVLKIARRDLPYFAMLGGLGMASVQFTYLYAISKLNVAPAILLQYLAPAFIVLYTVLVRREKTSWQVIAALTAALAGSYLVVGGYTFQFSKLPLEGLLAGVASAVSFAWYSLQGEYGMRRYGSWTVLAYSMLFAAFTWNMIEPPLAAFSRPGTSLDWGLVVYVSVFGTMIPYGLYLKGVSVIRSANASITAMLEPISAGVLSAVFLGEMLGTFQICGGVLVIAAIAFLQVKTHPSAKRSGPE